MRASETLQRRGYLVLAAGLVLGAVALSLYLLMPPAPSSDGFLHGRVSMDEIREHNHDVMMVFMLAGVAAAVAFSGFGLIIRGSRTLRAARNELISDATASVARGFQQGSTPAKVRLEELEGLRRAGLVTDAEYEAKRRDIIDGL